MSNINNLIESNYKDKFLVVRNEVSEYCNKSLYPLFNKFEILLRKYIFLIATLSEKISNKQWGSIKFIEKKDFANINILLFENHDLYNALAKYIEENKENKIIDKEKIQKIIEASTTETIWEKFNNQNIMYIQSDFKKIKEYRNNVMHSHNIKYEKFLEIKKFLSKVNEDLEKEINRIDPFSSKNNVFVSIDKMSIKVAQSVVKDFLSKYQKMLIENKVQNNYVSSFVKDISKILDNYKESIVKTMEEAKKIGKLTENLVENKEKVEDGE